MILNKNTAQETVEKLLNINAIKLSPTSPFTWSSGLKSPIYCDNRLVLSYPEIRNYITEEIGENIKKNYYNTNLIAGVATGAIGIGALVADYLKLPFVYVRPEAKKHGRKNQIEGHINKNQNVVIIEDLISTGKSSLNAYKALKNESISVNGIIAIFDYGFKTSAQIFAKNKILVHSLSNYDYLIKYALKKDFISSSQLELLSNWKNDPSNWIKWYIKMKIESAEIFINKPQVDVFEFLKDIKNFEILMPNNINKFELLASDKFIFSLNGMPEIMLIKTSEKPCELITLGSEKDNLDFILEIQIKTFENRKSLVKLNFEGNFNPIMATMIKKPISNFINSIAENISNVI